MNPRDPKTMERMEELVRGHGLKVLKQFERVIRQHETLDQTLTIVEKDEGFNPRYKTHTIVRESKIRDTTYDGALASLLKNRDRGRTTLEVVDRCLWVYVDERPDVNSADRVKSFSAAVFERMPHIRTWTAERYGPDLLQPVFTLDENLHYAAAIPIVFREFDPEMVRDVLIGRLMRRVLLYLDWVEYGRMLLEDFGVTLTWSTEKAARAERTKRHSSRVTIIGGRIPTITLPNGRYIRGQSKVDRVHFEGILPSVVAAQYAEMLRQE